MSKRIKIWTTLAVMVFVFFCCIVNAYAMESIDNNNYNHDQTSLVASESDTNAYPVLKEFLDASFSTDQLKSKSLHIYDRYNKDVTNAWIKRIQELFFLSRYDAIVKCIKENGLHLVTEERKVISTKGAVQTEYFSATSFEYGTTSDGYGKEWEVLLAGLVTYNTNTHVITSATSPTLSISYASWGTLWSPWLNNVSTNRTIHNNSYVTFSASYTMMGSLSYYSYAPPKTYNFGNYNISFNAYPSF